MVTDILKFSFPARIIRKFEIGHHEDDLAGRVVLIMNLLPNCQRGCSDSVLPIGQYRWNCLLLVGKTNFYPKWGLFQDTIVPFTKKTTFT